MTTMRSARKALRVPWPAVLALAMGLSTVNARADERESLESLRVTTLALIEALVERGLLTRQKANELLAQARAGAVAPPAAASAPSVAGAAGAAAAGATTAAAARAENVVRVPYVPQIVKDQIRDEVKEEVVAQAKAERWGVPNAQPEWTDRIKISGDLRVRYQGDHYQDGNPTPEEFLTASLAGVTRAADFAAGTAQGLPTANTTEDRDRLRLRARLSFDAKLSEAVSTGLRFTTGPATDRVSTNQTLGQDFNKYSLFIDLAYIRYLPIDWLNLQAGRIPNPWFSTNAIWNDNLTFEGLALTGTLPAQPWRTFNPFLTVGYFPIREDAPPKPSRALYGAQVGAQWDIDPNTRLKFGLAQYLYKNLEGRVDPDYDPVLGPGRSYGQYEYEAGLRQRGNTLFLTNNPQEIAAGLTPDKARWGLASRFAPQAITLAGELSQFSPVVVRLSGEWVRNSRFDRTEIAQRTGVTLTDGSGTGVQVRAVIGSANLDQAGNWQLTGMWRRMGSDAVLDAFTDSDLGLGGTNLRGYSIGMSYAFDRAAWLEVRYLSASTIDSPTVRPAAKDRFGVNTLLVDLNARF